MQESLTMLLQQAIHAFHAQDFFLAEQLLHKYLTIEVRDFEATHLLAIVYASMGKHEIAIHYYKSALVLNSNDPLLLSNFASSLNFLGQNQEALEQFKRVIQITPDDPDLLYNLGNIYYDLKNFDEAIIHYDQAIKLNPEAYLVHQNYGKVLFDLKQYLDAIKHYDQALAINKELIECLVNKGAALNELKRYEEAITHYDKALSINPDYAEAYCNKGVTLIELKRYEEAITHCDKALSLRFDYANAWFNKGLALNELKRYEEAITHYDKALSINPDYAEAYCNKGVTLIELKRYEEAITHCDKALSLKPDIDWLLGNLLYSRIQICEWSEIESDTQTLIINIQKNKRIISPFTALALIDDPKVHKLCAKIYVENQHPMNLTLGQISKRSKKDKLRIGYFSADFRNHAVSILMAELFELHNKERFEIFAFSFGPNDGSTLRFRLSQSFKQFIDVRSMSDKQIAELSRKLEIDIAVDLGGYTANNRMGIFSYRTAPIQVSYIGYLGTTGAQYIDYLIADRTIIPEGMEKYYTEKIVFLPNYQCNDRKRKISERIFTRQDLGLPESIFIFCCLNNNYKISPSIFDSWMKILKAVKHSVLLMYAENPWVEKNLKKEAESRGVDSNRLIFCTHAPPDEYLARYRACDLFLDTSPYNAGATASDALWAGLPVITVPGRTFSSRIAASLLHSIGIPELVLKSNTEYEELAVELANNAEKLNSIKQKLLNNRLSTALFDTPLFAKNIELAYMKMHERYLADLLPENLSLG